MTMSRDEPIRRAADDYTKDAIDAARAMPSRRAELRCRQTMRSDDDAEPSADASRRRHLKDEAPTRDAPPHEPSRYYAITPPSRR